METTENLKSQPPLSPVALRDVIELCLWAGQLLMQNGADSDRVESTVHRIGTNLGCNWLDVFIAANAIIITANNDPEFRTKTRRVVRFGGVNLGMIAAVNDLSFRVQAGELDRFGLRKELQALDKPTRYYNRWVTAVLTGLGCAAFSLLFGGNSTVFFVTWLASTLAMLARQEMHHRYFNPLLNVLITSFVSAFSVAGIAKIFPDIDLRLAFASSVLLLVPGVALINALEDLISGHSNVGVVRGLNGLLISFNIALGITLAIRLLGVKDLWHGLGHAPNWWSAAFWGALSAVCFAVLFNVPPRLQVWIYLLGGLAVGLRYSLVDRVGAEAATLIAASLVGIIAKLLAIRNRAPTIIFSLSAAIPMVPGALAFSTMIGILTLVGQLQSTSTSPADILVQTTVTGIKTGLLLAAIATGVTLPSLVFREKPVV
ncbi:MAG TPA: threonine/serine exporter family protein [Anaerolineales bacterium]|nr:threonine/serine exporter family protein [Anaerolineales bacterium]